MRIVIEIPDADAAQVLRSVQVALDVAVDNAQRGAQWAVENNLPAVGRNFGAAAVAIASHRVER